MTTNLDPARNILASARARILDNAARDAETRDRLAAEAEQVARRVDDANSRITVIDAALDLLNAAADAPADIASTFEMWEKHDTDQAQGIAFTEDDDHQVSVEAETLRSLLADAGYTHEAPAPAVRSKLDITPTGIRITNLSAE